MAAAAQFNNEHFMVMAFTEHQHERRLFPGAWPQHITIVPWMQGRRLQTIGWIAEAAAKFKPIKIEIDGNARFGGGKVPVWTLAKDAGLVTLHEAVLEAGAKAGTQFLNAKHTGPDKYSPHITKKEGQPERHIGERLLIDEISIVIGHGSEPKMLVQNIHLGGRSSEATS